MSFHAVKYVPKLYHGENSGWGYDKDKGRYFVAWEVNGMREVSFIDATTDEEAKAERDRRYIAAAMNGATFIYRGNPPSLLSGSEKPRTRVMDDGPDTGLVPVVLPTTVWDIYVKGKKIGRRRSKTNARRTRLEYLQKHGLNTAGEPMRPLRKCKFCGERPDWVVFKQSRSALSHSCIANYFPPCNKASGNDAAPAWNTYGWQGLPLVPPPRSLEFAPDGGELRRRRESFGVTTHQFAKLAGCHVMSVSFVERGHRGYTKRLRDKFEKAFRILEERQKEL